VNGRVAVVAGVLIAALSAGCAEPTPQFTEPMVLGGVEVSAEVLNRGQKLYANHCASCHGADGSGQGPAARHLNPGPRDFRKGEFIHKASEGEALPTDAELRRVIKKGVADRGMPAWGGLRDEDVDALVSYIKTFSPRWHGSVGDPHDAAEAE
jgi:mono/diheme cytochrome c family protein